MKIGIHYQNTEDSFVAGQNIAREAMKKADITEPDYVIAFCADSVDAEQFFQGLKSGAGEKVPIIGGSAIGVITNEAVSYSDYPACAAVVQSEDIDFKVAFSDQIDVDAAAAGENLIAKLSPQDEDKLLLVFYDSINKPASQTTPPVMNASAPLIEGLSRSTYSDYLTLGAGLLGSYNFGPTWQFVGDRILSQSAVGLMLSGPFHPYYKIFHGCTPLDGIYHTITRKSEDRIYELDNEPVVDVLDRTCGSQNWKQQQPVRLVTLGVNCGEKFGEPDEANYINKLITGILPDNSGIGLFEPDFSEGTEVQFMLRDPEKMLESAQHYSRQLVEQVIADNRKPICGLYIDCAGRTAFFSNTQAEEAALVQQTFNEYDIPLLGLYSGVEIAPLMGTSRGLDWTGVLIVFAED